MKIRSTGALLAAGLVAVLAGSGPAGAAPAYVRYPDIHGDRVVFCAEADLWMTSDTGGASHRLTTHVGTEYFPHFSPDGERIAFTGEYDGNRDVFVMAAEGGEPRRLTWHPESDEVLGWTPDGARILFRSRRQEPNRVWELFSVPADGGDAEKLPLAWAARIDIDPATGAWAFNRTTRETRTWKRYRGGTATDIWVGHPDLADFRKVTDFDGMDAFPMWHGGRIYFLSDQGGTANLWSMLADGTDRRQHTTFSDWDARWPAMGPDGRIVFTLAADIYLFDPATGEAAPLQVDVRSDRTLTRSRYPDAGGALSWFTLSPKADRLAVVARGEIFSVPVKEGVTLPVTRGSGARESWAGFDPEGKKIVYVTDATREEEIRAIDAWGNGEPRVIKHAGESGWHLPPVYSPDGKWIAYADQTQSLYVMPAEGGTPRTVDRSERYEIRMYSWSPDGRWLAYAKALPNDYFSIFIYDTRTMRIHTVTGPTTNDMFPAWDPKGRYLYFISSRNTNPLLGSRDFQNIEARNDKPHLVTLREDVPNPFINSEGLPPKEDAEGEKDAKEGNDEGGEKKDGKDKKPEPVEIDLEGLMDRHVEFPVPYGSYFGLGATAKNVFYLSAPMKGMAEMPGLFQESGPDLTLISFDLEKKKPKPFMEGVSAFDLAAKTDKIAVMKKRGEIYVVDAGSPPGNDLGESKVSLDDMVIDLDPREEWEQIYYEGWRHMRDFYWDAGMGGVDWRAVRDQYATLLPRLATRDDLRDLMGEMIGELSTSHTYVFGGDAGVHVPRVATGMLGADLEKEGEAYRVVRVYRGDPADNVRSPLSDPSARVAEGDYILAINHLPFVAGRPFAAHLEGLGGKEVVLTVNNLPSREGARDVVVQALRNERRLRYCDWVRRNREYVAERSGGKIGYVHIPDMWIDGLVAFNTWFYPQLDKEGMVVDVRWNRGGAVSEMILERLRRRLQSYSRARSGGLSAYPYRVLNGPFVVLLNEFAGSDGDIFPYAVQLEGLAPVIGMRSWGGVVGIRGDKLLVDGGFLTEPEFAWWDPKLGWELENRGVLPDIEVQNLPQDLARGVDAQLDRGIDEVLELHTEHPPLRPDFGPARDRSRGAYRKEIPPPEEP